MSPSRNKASDALRRRSAAALRPASSLGSFRLDRSGSTPLFQQLYVAIRGLIVSGAWTSGTKLPSTRALMAELGISRTTVTTAIELLASDGLIQTHVGSGTYVARRQRAMQPPPLISAGKGPAPSRRSLILADHVSVDVGSGPVVPFEQAPALDAFPHHLWSRLAARVAREAASARLNRCEAAGYGPLRDALAGHLAATRGVACHPDQIAVTSGGAQALDLLARILVDEGDEVWVEEPTDPRVRRTFAFAGARLVGIPVDDEGLDVDRARELAPTARLAYVTPANQRPLGVTMSAARREALLGWALDAEAWVVEYDRGELSLNQRPLAAKAGYAVGHVVYTGTLSRVLTQSLRLGFIVAPSALVDRLTAARALVDLHPPILPQAITAAFIAEGHLARHVARMRRLYLERLSATREAAAANCDGLIQIEADDAGLHAVGLLAPGLDDRDVAHRARDAGLVVIPLSRFYAGPPRARGGLLLGYGGTTPSVQARAFQRLGAVLRQSQRR